MKIEDNFLEQKIFDELQAHMMGNNFDWYYNDGIDYEYEGLVSKDPLNNNNLMFFHIFYYFHRPQSPHFQNIDNILNKLLPISIWRIKANLFVGSSNIIKNAFHVDMDDVPEEKLKQWTTSIFYVNTNNGHTEFEDGTKVESVANRLVTFPSNLKHRGTSCTDEKTRIVINFNYFKNSTFWQYRKGK